MKFTNQLPVECSDPGLVVTLAEELENVLRNIDFARARFLQGQLHELSRDLGPEFEEAWRDFRIEVPNDDGVPLSFGTRNPVDEEKLGQLLCRAEEQGIGKFEVRNTFLLSQDGPPPETQEQYVRDLADAIRFCYHDDLSLLQYPLDLPESIESHRLRLVDELAGEVLRARAKYPSVGHSWIQDTMKRLEEALREVNTRAEAVMEYELSRVNVAEVEPESRLRWAALAVRLGKEVEKWYLAAEEELEYLYQRVALIHLLWTDIKGRGKARPFLEGRLKLLSEQAEKVYSADAREALRLISEELCKSPWSRLDKLRDDGKADKENDHGAFPSAE